MSSATHSWQPDMQVYTKKSTDNSGNLAGLIASLSVSQQRALSFTPNMSEQHVLPLLPFHNLLTQSVSFWSYQHFFLSMYRRKVMVMSAYIVRLKSKAGVTTVNAAFTYLCLLHLDTTIAWHSLFGHEIENMSSWTPGERCFLFVNFVILFLFIRIT